MLRVYSCGAEAMRKALSRGMLAVCLLFSLQGGLHANLQRTAQLVHGELVTSREMLLVGQGAEARRLVESSEPHVWVLGLHPTQERQVQGTLASVSGKVLHPLPGKASHHLVVQADENAIRHVLEQHEEATAAVLHHTMKVSPGVQMHVHHLQHEGGQPHMTLLVLLPRASDEARDAVVHAAQQQLPSELASIAGSCHLHVEQDGFFVQITVCLEGADPAALWAAQQRGVTWVDIAPTTKVGNLYANAITQSATKLHDEMDGGPSSPPPLDVLQGVSSGMFPLWQAGLDGTGQIAAVIDTGIDADSCFFWDPAYDFNASTTLKTLPNVGNKTQVASFPNHRKLVELIAYQGSIDQYGHGTHTSCTVLGSAPGFNISQPPLLGTGIAPGAKLVAVDGGPDNLATEDVLTPFHPANLYTHIKGVGAYVTSNSWGSNMFYYGAYCVSWDDFARSAPDMLHVFSAGNNAVVDRHLTRTNGTVGSPGFCKNVLTVGATESWVPDGWQYDHSTWLPFNLTANGQPLDVSSLVSNYTLPPRFLATVPGTLTFEVLPSQPAARRLQQGSGNQTFVLDSNKLEWFNQPGFLSTFSSTIPNTLNLVLADPPNGCSITGNVSNTGVLLVRKTAADLNATKNDTSPAGCTPLKVAMLAKQAGAAGVLMYWDGVNYTALPDTANFTFPAGIIAKPGVGQQLAQLLDGGATVTVTYHLGQSAPRPDDVLPFENVAEFSSFNGVANGTGQDSRFKPDLMAPGFLISAYSNRRDDSAEDQCTVVPSAGTSMATPVVAGSAILARQYFMQGFYPSGEPNATDAFTPSGPLLKAVLIAGTAAMQGYSMMDGQRLPPPPSPTQGFGRLNLSASLPLATNNSTANSTNTNSTSNSTSAAWRMHAIDNIQLLANGTSYTYQVQVLDGGAPAPLVVTVVWHDIPGYPGNTRVLVNDLDLTVQDPSGTTYWGNNITNGDRVNNVEKVYIPAAAPGVYQITINTVYIFDDAQAGAQNFSMVLLGNVPPGPSASQTRSTPAPAPGGGNIVLNPNYTSPSPSWWLPSPSPTGGAAGALHFNSILAALGHRVLLACLLVAVAALSQLAH